MAKKNHMLAQIEAKYAAMFDRRLDILAQKLQDAAMIAAHDVLGLGPGRAQAFVKALKDSLDEIDRLTLEDAKDDKQLWYTKAKLDEQLLAIVGPENFAPFDERYYGIKENP